MKILQKDVFYRTCIILEPQQIKTSSITINETTSIVSYDDLYQKLYSYRDAAKLTQVGLVAEEFLQWLGAEGNDAGSIPDLIPAYLEYRMNSDPYYNKEAVEAQLRTLGLNSSCVTFMCAQAAKLTNDNQQDAFFCALQYCLHQFSVIFEIPLKPPITSGPLNQIQPLDIKVAKDLLSILFETIQIKNFYTNNIQIGLKETGMKEFFTNTKLLFHATAAHYAASIVRNGIDATSTRINLDLGPEFYLNTHFRDAKDWCMSRFAPTCNGQAAIFIFQVPKDIYDEWNIHQLDYRSRRNDLNNLTEWEHFVKKCRAGIRNNRIIGSYDGFEGPQCANPRDLLNEASEIRPEIRRTNEARPREAWQISIHSSGIQAHVINYLKGVITFTNI
ncbi:unnamed protein product [Adineta steineri]|uniref:Uncharacterized protein n=1 Tax=Adineta steineri TaxID=433720 RepID=A0A814MGP1_9BILA|nr:unnamed protein product [Adineta steineri]CAF1317632.1 unnamed protein product [Adineta steineri]